MSMHHLSYQQFGQFCSLNCQIREEIKGKLWISVAISLRIVNMGAFILASYIQTR